MCNMRFCVWLCPVQALQPGQASPGCEPAAAPNQVLLPSTLLVEALNEHVSTLSVAGCIAAQNLHALRG
jgi:hypothetical protein